MRAESFIEGMVVAGLLILFGIGIAATFAGALVLAALRLIVTPGGAAITIALIGLYVWLNGGFA